MESIGEILSPGNMLHRICNTLLSPFDILSSDNDSFTIKPWAPRLSFHGTVSSVYPLSSLRGGGFFLF